MFLDGAPCGLWQSAQFMAPSRSGMWPERAIAVRLSLWHVMHRWLTSPAVSIGPPPSFFAWWMLWHLTHETSLRACALWSQWNCSPLLWHPAQVDEASSAGIFFKLR